MTQGLCSKERAPLLIQSTELVDFTPARKMTSDNRIVFRAVARRAIAPSEHHSLHDISKNINAAAPRVRTAARITTRTAALLSGRIRTR